MKGPAFSACVTVSEAIQSHPAIARIFLDLRTLCVGCYLMHFCTLEEVATAYELPLTQLLENLHTAASERPMRTIRTNEIAS